ncbi:MAG: hypothetical protein IPF94_19410 [Betaproteobacteria bacterium]|nr:hypothetical protein [Betaproteobacteria bacterium]
MNTSLAKTLKVALLGCAVALGAVRTADAAYVVINADPQYGAQFPDLSWRAIGALYVPNVCLTVGQFANVFSNPQTFYFADFDPICGTSAIQSVQLRFYKTNTNALSRR